MRDDARARPRIVVGVDGSDSAEQALAWAVGQAKATGGSLEVLVAWHWPAAPSYSMATPIFNPQD